MKSKGMTLLPRLSKILEEAGENIKLARLRRNLTMEQVSERAGISRSTLWQEKRDFPLCPSVYMLRYCLYLAWKKIFLNLPGMIYWEESFKTPNYF